MILRSVMKHVRDQNWFAVSLDFLIVVVGVFIGIQVANWNDFRAELDLEQRYLQRLEASLVLDIAEHDDAVALAEHRLDRSRLLIAAYADPAVALERPSELFDAVVTAGFTYQPSVSDAVFDEMVATGNARIIRDDSLRDAIAEYYGLIDMRTQWKYIREHTQLGYMDRRAGLLTPEQERRIWSANGTARFTPDEATALVERMASFSELKEWLPFAEAWQNQQATDYREFGSVARALKDRIQGARSQSQNKTNP